MLPRDNSTLVYTRKQEKSNKAERAGFQERTKTVKEKGDIKGKKNKRETRIPESHIHITYTRQATSHMRSRFDLHPRPWK